MSDKGNTDDRIRKIEISLTRQDERISNLAGSYMETGETMKDVKKALDALKQEFSDLKLYIAEKNGSRPTWGVSIVITILTGIVVGLAVYVATMPK